MELDNATIEKIRIGLAETLNLSDANYLVTKTLSGQNFAFADETLDHILYVLQLDNYHYAEILKVLAIYRKEFSVVDPTIIQGRTDVKSRIDREIKKYEQLLSIDLVANKSNVQSKDNQIFKKEQSEEQKDRTQNAVLITLKILLTRAGVSTLDIDITEIARFFEFVSGYDKENFRRWYNEPFRKGGKNLHKEQTLVCEKLRLIGINLSPDQLWNEAR